MTDLIHLSGSHEAKQKAAIDAKSSDSHTHSISNVSGLQAALDAKNPLISAGAHVVDAPTNAPNNAPTNLNVLTTLLGALVGEVNATNAKQNQTANNVNEVAAKLNTLLSRLEAAGILQSS